MFLDPDKGLYVFEVVLGYKVNEEPDFTIPYLIQADQPDEAEDKVWEFLDENGVAEEFWIEELSDPYLIEEYQQVLEENGDQAYILLEVLTKDDFHELLGY